MEKEFTDRSTRDNRFLENISHKPSETENIFQIGLRFTFAKQNDFQP